MSKTGNFLWRLFCVLVVFLYHRPSDAYSKRVVCPKNQYVKSCSGYVVGTNWLNGGHFKANEKQGKKIPELNIEPYYNKLPDDATIDQQEELHAKKVAALRYFFNQAGEDANQEPTAENEIIANIKKVDAEKMDAEAKLNQQPYTVASDLLTLLCTDSVECAPCEGGLVNESSYEYDTTSILANTWKFYTIADCYKEDFSDSSGTFKYIDYANNPIQCKYNTDEETAVLKGYDLNQYYYVR